LKSFREPLFGAAQIFARSAVECVAFSTRFWKSVWKKPDSSSQVLSLQVLLHIAHSSVLEISKEKAIESTPRQIAG
jgi:hypothetical protein